MPIYNSKLVDYGRPSALGLSDPSFATCAAMSLVRVCGAAVKIKDGTVKNDVIKMCGHAISFPHAAVGICNETIVRPLPVQQLNQTELSVEAPIDALPESDGFPSCPNIFPQPGHIRAEIMLYFAGPKKTIDHLMM